MQSAGFSTEIFCGGQWIGKLFMMEGNNDCLEVTPSNKQT